jgi:GT2 family glycosyltransferase
VQIPVETDCARHAPQAPSGIPEFEMMSNGRPTASGPMKKFAVSIVAYHPDAAGFSRCLASLREQRLDGWQAELHVLDNSCSQETEHSLRARVDAELGGDRRFVQLRVVASNENLGFGRGHNRNMEATDAPLVLILNQDIELEPAALDGLLAEAETDLARVAAWELRQIPYEHPKSYDPVKLTTPWVSGAAVLLRSSAFREAGGFDPKIFMYGEDVDLSWRLRSAGWLLRYLPRFACVHRTYEYPDQVKPAQLAGSTLTNLCLRARFGRRRMVLRGLVMLVAELSKRQAFPGRRAALARNLLRFLTLYPHFRRTRVQPNADFSPFFAGWDYELRRDGPFFEFPSRREWPGENPPKVSILIRAIGRHAWLREALASVANQTYPNVEAVVVEDGPATSQDVVAEFDRRLPIVYRALGQRLGRSHAGNLAMASATGEWMGFLDDDDVLFADHVEVLLYSAQRAGAKATYSIAWEMATRTLDQQRAVYEEVLNSSRFAEPFDRIALWHHNYIPIQAALFHRSLYERHGGFEVDMEQLEDWNLWTRYSLHDDFVFVPKTTSKYRVPAEAHVHAERQRQLDEAYADALERQKQIRVDTDLRTLCVMINSHVQKEAERIARLSVVPKMMRPFTRWVLRTPRLAWLARHAPAARQILVRLRRM